MKLGDFCLLAVGAVGNHKRIRRCEIRCSKFDGEIVSGTESKCNGQTNSTQSIANITTQLLLALQTSVPIGGNYSI